MKHVVIEKVGDNYTVTLHPTDGGAEDYAVMIALENTACSEEEVRQHLRQRDCHEEGDYAVILAVATFVED